MLGESCYNWVDPPGSGILHCPQPDHLIMIVNESMKNPVGNSTTMNKLTRAVSNTENPTSPQAAEGWDCVAFTNYVPVTVGDGARRRPTKAGWQQAEEEWIPLLSRLKPSVVIVLGLTMWSRIPVTQTVQSPLVQGYRLDDGHLALCRATRHPSWGPGWATYAAMIIQGLEGAA